MSFDLGLGDGHPGEHSGQLDQELPVLLTQFCQLVGRRVGCGVRDEPTDFHLAKGGVGEGAPVRKRLDAACLQALQHLGIRTGPAG